MAESTLSLAYPEILRRLSVFVSYGRDTSSLTDDQVEELQEYIATGYRRFLFPTRKTRQEGRTSYKWRFLKPVRSLATEADAWEYDLPDDFGSIRGPILFNQVGPYAPIPIRGEGEIYDRRQRITRTGRPEIAAIRPKEGTGVTGTRFDVIFWPTPNAVYSLLYRSNLYVGTISVAYPYPIGGMEYGEALMAQILAAAEELADDEIGVKAARAAELLQDAIEHDAAKAPETLGVCDDGTAAGRILRPSDRITHLTYEGLLPDSIG